MLKNLFLIITISLLFSSCYYDSEEDLYPNAPCNVGINVSYANQIKPIIENKCISCHRQATQNGGINLEGHGQMKIYINNGSLIGSIKHLAGYSKMPVSSPKLSDCNILKIEKWIAEGALNN
jgi:hypothetical protein